MEPDEKHCRDVAERILNEIGVTIEFPEIWEEACQWAAETRAMIQAVPVRYLDNLTRYAQEALAKLDEEIEKEQGEPAAEQIYAAYDTNTRKETTMRQCEINCKQEKRLKELWRTLKRNNAIPLATFIARYEDGQVVDVGFHCWPDMTREQLIALRDSITRQIGDE